MKFTNLVAAGALATSLVSPVIMADTTTPMSDAQKKEIQKVVHDYLVSNPEVLLEASQAYQQKQQESMKEQAQTSIQQNTDQIFEGKLTTAGNPKGNVTIVEFFDYQCIHCKKMAPTMESLIQKDSDLRVIYKEFPIFGESSDMASRVALAAGIQGKYLAMHNALLKIEKSLDEQSVMNAAQALGLDMIKLKTDMAGKEVTDILDANRQLAEKLHLMGTPAFIVASTPNGQFKVGSTPAFIPGAASEQSLQELIKKAAGN